MSRAIKLQDSTSFLLPAGVIGRPDISRVIREIEKVDYAIEAQSVRAPGQPITIPAMSRGLVEIAGTNGITIEDLEARKKLLRELRNVKEHAPVLQITFAVDPEPDILMQLVAWIRQNLHPTALVTVGLQPAIVGGCIVRTPDHIYDFSMRNQFKKQLPDLIQSMRTVTARIT